MDYAVIFIRPDGIDRYHLGSPLIEGVDDQEFRLSQVLWIDFSDQINSDDITTLVISRKGEQIQHQWVWVKQIGRLRQVF